MQHDTNFRNRMSTVTPYSLLVYPGSLCAADPAPRHEFLRPFYYAVGQRFATPVNLRLQGQLNRFGLRVDHQTFVQALNESIQNHSVTGVKPIMRSAFLDGVVTASLTGFTGPVHTLADFSPGPPPLHTSGYCFLELMTEICDTYLSLFNNRHLPLRLREDLSIKKQFKDDYPESKQSIDLFDTKPYGISDPSDYIPEYMDELSFLDSPVSDSDSDDEKKEDVHLDSVTKPDSPDNSVTKPDSPTNSVTNTDSPKQREDPLEHFTTGALLQGILGDAGKNPTTESIMATLLSQPAGFQTIQNACKYGMNAFLFGKLGSRQMKQDLLSRVRQEVQQKLEISNKIMDAIVDKDLVENWASVYGQNPLGSNCFKVYHCRKWCMAFTGQYRTIPACIHCQSPRQDNCFIYYYSIRSFLRTLIADSSLVDVLFSERPSSGTTSQVSDFWSSGLYRQLQNTRVSNSHSSMTGKMEDKRTCFSTSHEIALMLFSDGTKVEDNRSLLGELMTMAFTILNLPLQTRSLDKAIFTPYMFIKTPESLPTWTSDTMTFLTPLLDDLAEMSTRGFLAYHGRLQKRVTVYAHLVMLNADTISKGYLMGMKGRSSNFPCEVCEVQKVASGRNGRGGGITMTAVEIYGQVRTAERYKNYPWAMIENSDPNSSIDEVVSVGLRFRSHLEKSLGTLIMPYCAPVDFVRMMYQNLGENFVKLLADFQQRPETQNNTDYWYDGCLDRLNETVEMLERLPEEVGGGEDFGRGSVFARVNDFFGWGGRLERPKSWKLVVSAFPLFWWISYINKRHLTRVEFNNGVKEVYYYSVLKQPDSPSQQLFSLVTEMMVILRIMELPSLSVQDLNHVHGACVKFQEKLEAILGISKSTLPTFDLSLHHLQHLQDTIYQCGMPSEYSAQPVQSVIFNVLANVQSGKLRHPKRDLARELSEAIGFRASAQLLLSSSDLKKKTGVYRGSEPFMLTSTTLDDICHNYHLGFDESGANVEAVGLFRNALKEKCLRKGIEYNEDKIKFYESGQLSIRGAKSTFLLDESAVVKCYQNSTPIYGKCLSILTAQIPTSDGAKVTMNFVLVNWLKTYPLIMNSALWFDTLPNNLGTPITIGRLARLNRRPKLAVINPGCIKGKGYTLPVPDAQAPGTSKLFEFILDCNPLTVDEILRVPTLQEVTHILNSHQMLACASQRGEIKESTIFQTAIKSLEEEEPVDDDW